MKAEVVCPTEENPDEVVPGRMAIGEAACVSVLVGTDSALTASST
jgi:hypothetical protein